MSKELQIFHEYLQKKGLKLTKPREIILEEVFYTKKHFNVDELYDQIKRKYDNVSRATVYRTIPLLIEANLIKNALRCAAKDHYEHIYGSVNHFHLVCKQCGKIIEEDLNEVEEVLQKYAELHNFKIEEFNIGANGYCSDCKKDN
jgi:Fur family ferric uptake transcriptional regulator